MSGRDTICVIVSEREGANIIFLAERQPKK
jgi:hypothetical protein